MLCHSVSERQFDRFKTTPHMYNLQNTKDEISETIARNFHCLFPYIHDSMRNPGAAVVHLNFRAGSTFPVQACTVPSSMDRTSRCSKVDAVRLYASHRLNLLLLKRQRCVNRKLDSFFVKLLNQLLNYYILGRIHDLASLYLKSFR